MYGELQVGRDRQVRHRCLMAAVTRRRRGDGAAVVEVLVGTAGGRDKGGRGTCEEDARQEDLARSGSKWL